MFQDEKKEQTNHENNMSLDEMKEYENRMIGYWKVPLGVSIWGLQPNYLGNHLKKNKKLKKWN